MNQMEIFKNPEFGSIRVIEENGKQNIRYQWNLYMVQEPWTAN